MGVTPAVIPPHPITPGFAPAPSRWNPQPPKSQSGLTLSPTEEGEKIQTAFQFNSSGSIPAGKITRAGCGNDTGGAGREPVRNQAGLLVDLFQQHYFEESSHSGFVEQDADNAGPPFHLLVESCQRVG